MAEYAISRKLRSRSNHPAPNATRPRQVLMLAGFIGLVTVVGPARQDAPRHAAAPSAAPSAAPGYFAEIVAALQQKWPKNRTINIVCHGHSVPAGYFATPTVDTFNAYPHLFHRKLKDRFPHAVINMIVTAIGGENATAGAARFDQDVLTHRPDVLLIDYALNDRPIGLDVARRAWTQMIQNARAANVRVILLTPTPDTRALLDDPADPLNQHAEQIRQLAAKYDLPLVDSLAAFQHYTRDGGKLTDLMSQSNHPNARGHALVAAELMKLLPIEPCIDG